MKTHPWRSFIPIEDQREKRKDDLQQAIDKRTSWQRTENIKALGDKRRTRGHTR